MTLTPYALEVSPASDNVFSMLWGGGKANPPKLMTYLWHHVAYAKHISHDDSEMRTILDDYRHKNFIKEEDDSDGSDDVYLALQTIGLMRLISLSGQEATFWISRAPIFFETFGRAIVSAAVANNATDVLIMLAEMAQASAACMKIFLDALIRAADTEWDEEEAAALIVFNAFPVCQRVMNSEDLLRLIQWIHAEYPENRALLRTAFLKGMWPHAWRQLTAVTNWDILGIPCSSNGNGETETKMLDVDPAERNLFWVFDQFAK